jgi:hypothetical protein
MLAWQTAEGFFLLLADDQKDAEGTRPRCDEGSNESSDDVRRTADDDEEDDGDDDG